MKDFDDAVDADDGDVNENGNDDGDDVVDDDGDDVDDDGDDDDGDDYHHDMKMMALSVSWDADHAHVDFDIF